MAVSKTSLAIAVLAMLVVLDSTSAFPRLIRRPLSIHPPVTGADIQYSRGNIVRPLYHPNTVVLVDSPYDNYDRIDRYDRFDRIDRRDVPDYQLAGNYIVERPDVDLYAGPPPPGYTY